MVNALAHAGRRIWRGAKRTATASAVAAAAAGTWGLVEAQAYTLRRRTILLDGAQAGNPASAGRTLRILHLSDSHLLGWQHRRAAWIENLAATEPDLVVLTGDLIASPAALTPLFSSLSPFAGTAGAFVFGSNDYYQPQPKNPLSYLAANTTPQSHESEKRAEQPWQELQSGLEAFGWHDLTNQRAHLDIGNWSLDAVGVDDPHLDRDEFPLPLGGSPQGSPQYGTPYTPGPQQVVGTTPDGATYLRVGLTHAPYKRILDAMTADGCALVFAGHTHGGQVCLPGAGALVTNCDLEREYASGLFQWPPTGMGVMHGDGTVPTGTERRPTAWINVSAGLGTSPFAPVRIACRPEAVLLDLVVI